MKLVVKTDSRDYFINPEGFVSSDRCAAVVGAFCHRHGIPYSETFVSIAIVNERRQSPLATIGERHVFNLNDQFGQYAIELNNDVIDDIQVVAMCDFQTVICHAIQIWCGDPDGRPLSEYLGQNLIDLRRESPEEKKLALERAGQTAPRAGYAEARIFRSLRTCDKKMPSS